MSTLVGRQPTVVSGVNASVILNNNVYLTAKSFTAKWGNPQEENRVVGTDMPVVTTAWFKGEADLDIIYSTENTSAKEQFIALLTPILGQIVGVNLEWAGSDSTGLLSDFRITGSAYPDITE